MDAMPTEMILERAVSAFDSLKRAEHYRAVHFLMQAGATEREIAIECPYLTIIEIREAERDICASRGLLGKLEAMRYAPPTADEIREYDEIAAPARVKLWLRFGWSAEEVASRFSQFTVDEVRAMDDYAVEEARRAEVCEKPADDPRGALGLVWGDSFRAAHEKLAAAGFAIDDIYADEDTGAERPSGEVCTWTNGGDVASLCFDDTGLYRIDVTRGGSDDSGERELAEKYGAPDVVRGDAIKIWYVHGTDITVVRGGGESIYYESRERVRAHAEAERARLRGSGEPTPVRTGE